MEDRPLKEIERRFRLNCSIADFIYRAESELPSSVAVRSLPSELIEQVYLQNTGDWTIRGRHVMYSHDGYSDDYILTMKHRLTAVECIEIETLTSSIQYAVMAGMCGHKPLVKRRYHHAASGFTIDQFLNPELNDLALAEIELTSPDQTFPIPWFIGEEVTGQITNRRLAEENLR
jgi:CYTH domain-containing protein